MKKILALAAALTVLWTANTWAEATINLNNLTGGSIFYLTEGTLAPAAGTFAQVLYNGTALTDRDSGLSTFELIDSGLFYGGTAVVPGLADSATAEFTLRAWKGAAGSTWDAAAERGSVTWSQATGAYNPNAVPPAVFAGPDLSNPAVTIVVPEPTTIALGLLGGAALLLFRRK